MRGVFGKKKRKKSTFDVSGPSNAIHEGHVGISDENGMNIVGKLPDEWNDVMSGLNEALASMGQKSVTKKEVMFILQMAENNSDPKGMITGTSAASGLKLSKKASDREATKSTDKKHREPKREAKRDPKKDPKKEAKKESRKGEADREIQKPADKKQKKGKDAKKATERELQKAADKKQKKKKKDKDPLIQKREREDPLIQKREREDTLGHIKKDKAKIFELQAHVSSLIKDKRKLEGRFVGLKRDFQTSEAERLKLNDKVKVLEIDLESTSNLLANERDMKSVLEANIAEVKVNWEEDKKNWEEENNALREQLAQKFEEEMKSLEKNKNNEIMKLRQQSMKATNELREISNELKKAKSDLREQTMEVHKLKHIEFEVEDMKSRMNKYRKEKLSVMQEWDAKVKELQQKEIDIEAAARENDNKLALERLRIKRLEATIEELQKKSHQQSKHTSKKESDKKDDTLVKDFSPPPALKGTAPPVPKGNAPPVAQSPQMMPRNSKSLKSLIANPKAFKNLQRITPNVSPEATAPDEVTASASLSVLARAIVQRREALSGSESENDDDYLWD